MKYILSSVGVLIVCLSFFLFKAEPNEEKCFCVNVVSNSSSENDEMIKFKVKDKISSFFNNQNENISSKINESVDDISFMTNQILSLYHCDYVCEVKISEEKTPNLDFANINLVGKTCKTIYVKLGSGMGKESWQVFYE